MFNLAPAAAAALEQRTLDLGVWVEMLLTQPVRYVSGGHPIPINGMVYTPTGAFGTVEPVEDSPGENKPLRLQLSGVSNDTLALAMSEPIRNKPISMGLVYLHQVTHAVLDAHPLWVGTLDQMSIDYGTEASSIGVIALHGGTTYARPKTRRYIDADQQAQYPGDTSLRFITSQANRQDVWPAASFFRV